jgi:predicted transcriptional regulator
LSNREIEGIKAGLKDIGEGRVNPHEEVMKSINLKLENFKSNGK